jgi:hypothetical protein
MAYESVSQRGNEGKKRGLLIIDRHQPSLLTVCTSKGDISIGPIAETARAVAAGGPFGNFKGICRGRKEKDAGQQH